MKERPIVFSGEMVQAILEGRKTQTRRVIKPQPPLDEWGISKWETSSFEVGIPYLANSLRTYTCPYGQPGDKLWIRETWAHDDPDCDNVYCENVDHIWYKASEVKIVADSFSGKAHWRSSIFMPRWASRITLEIVSVRVEKVRDISEADAIAEGMIYHDNGLNQYNQQKSSWVWKHEGIEDSSNNCLDSARFAFGNLWDSINAERGYSWENKPWVWVIEFKKYPELRHHDH